MIEGQRFIVQLITHVCHCEEVAIVVVGRANYIGLLLV